MNNIVIRNIEEKDHYNVECVTKRAFWNLNMPGCDEHYLVHRLWTDSAYVPEISLVAELEGCIVGAILYAKAKIETGKGSVDTLLFGPLCVAPELQKSGIGGLLLKASVQKARECGYTSIFICGVPTYYPKFGFVTADHFQITMPDGSNFDAFMGIELVENALENVAGKFYEPDVYAGDIHDSEYLAKIEEFDKDFPYMRKEILPQQWR